MGCNCGKKKISTRQPKKVTKSQTQRDGTVGSSTTVKRIIRRVQR